MYSRMNGRRSSRAVPTNFTKSTSSISRVCLLMYDQMNFMWKLLHRGWPISNERLGNRLENIRWIW